jgi:predicted alpha/beta superfamily hydrolase
MVRATILLCLLALVTHAVAAQESRQEIVIGQKFTLHSEVLKEDRPYWIYLPRSYNDSQLGKTRYPVLYLLDGNAYFHMGTGVVQHLVEVDRIPDVIVVGIPNTVRTRDMTPTHMAAGPYSARSGGAPQFLRFLKEELFPKIESQYRTLPHRTLVGHSLTGLFTLYALLESPESFNACVALDPSVSWDDQVLLKRLDRFTTKGLKHPTSVFIARANSPDTWYGGDHAQKQLQENSIKNFAAKLSAKSSPLLRSELRLFEDDDHMSVPLPGMYRGLLYAFDVYPPAEGIYQIGPEALSSHFAKISARLGVTLLPPEGLVDFRAQQLIGTNPDQAIAFLKMNASNYPDSSRASANLAKALERLSGEVPSALRSLRPARS